MRKDQARASMGAGNTWMGLGTSCKGPVSNLGRHSVCMNLSNTPSNFRICQSSFTVPALFLVIGGLDHAGPSVSKPSALPMFGAPRDVKSAISQYLMFLVALAFGQEKGHEKSIAWKSMVQQSSQQN